jgi:hypothetical protein
MPSIMKSNPIRRVIPAVFIAVLMSPFVFCKRNADDRVVAKMGRAKITLAEFRIQYTRFLLRPDRFDSPRMRRDFLESMIDHRLLAEQGRGLGLDADPWIRRFTASYRDKLARDRYIEKKVYPRTPKTDRAEVERVFSWLQQERRIRHLFAPTREAADSLRRLLDSGRTFESIARTAFRDSAVAAAGGDLGWVRWDQMDIDLADAVFEQPRGVVSGPVRSRYGYHVIRVDDIRGTPLLSDMDFGRAESRVRSLIVGEKREKVLDEWVRGFMPGLGIRLNPDVFPEVARALAARLGRPRGPSLPSEAQISHREWKSFMDPLARLADRPVAWTEGKPLTVSEFLDGLFWVPYAVTASNPVDALGCVIRDRHITELAADAGMDRDPDVRAGTRLAAESLVDEKYRASLIDSIRVTEAEIRTCYGKNIGRYSEAPLLDVRKIRFADRAAAGRWRPGRGTGAAVLDTALRGVTRSCDRTTYDRAVMLSPGSVGGPFREDGGWTVLMLERKIPAAHSLEDVKDLVAREILAEKRASTVPGKIAELRKRTKIVTFPEVLDDAFGRTAAK